MRVGIDGSNLRTGGGVTHLAQLLGAAEPALSGIERVTVWGARRLLDDLPDRAWLARTHEAALDGNAISRTVWQQRRLARVARGAVDLLFAPGGTYIGAFRPFVTMFRNMLPWDAAERQQYGLSRMRVKLEVLRRTQAATLRRAGGVIFLTEHAKAHVLREVTISGTCAVIPHGLDPRFFAHSRAHRLLAECDAGRPFRWLYVSAIHSYKHPWNVAEAVAMLRNADLPVSLDIVGPPYLPALARLEATIGRLDPRGRFLRIVPGVPHSELPALYQQADGFVFASTCENMPNSVLEAMAAALPIVCSDRAPMPEILGDGGVYVDPRDAAALAAAMTQLMADHRLRARVAATAQARARAFSWTRCARDTFDFIAEVGRSTGVMQPAAPTLPS